MQLGTDSSTTSTDLIGFTRFLTNTTDNTSAFPAADIKAQLNQAQQDAQVFIINSAMSQWKGESAIKHTDLVSGQDEYKFPADILTVDRIEVSYDGNYWYPAVYKNIELFDSAFYNRGAGEGVVGTTDKPVYTIYDYSLWLDPVPDKNITNGFKLWFSTNLTDLSSSTDEPVFNRAFHEILGYIAASKWCGAKEEWDKKKSLDRDLKMIKNQMEQFYTKRILDHRPRITRKKRVFE